jgi:hypothetical protein
MRKLIGPMLAAVLLHGGLLAAYLAGFGGDLSALVCAPHERLGQPPFEVIRTGFPRSGYDGQFYYYLARAPWSRHDADLDQPISRQLRILYPAISWLISGGDAVRLLWVMPLVNLLAIAALAGLGAVLARRHGLSPFWGVLLPVAVNAGMPLLRDLTDIVSAATVTLLLAAWILRWRGWLLGLAALAALLSREQNLLVVGVVLAAAWRTPVSRPAEAEAEQAPGRPAGRPVACLLAALALWGCWLLTLRGVYGEWRLLSASENFAPPMQGFLSRWESVQEASRSQALLHRTCLGLLLIQIALTLYLLVDGPRDQLALVIALAGIALVLLASTTIYNDTWCYTRAFAWLPLGVWIGCVQVRWRWPLVVLSLPLLLPLAVIGRVWLRGV